MGMSFLDSPLLYWYRGWLLIPFWRRCLYVVGIIWSLLGLTKSLIYA